MADDGFGSALWRNVQAVKLGKDGGLEVPVRASSSEGIVIGVDAIAESDARRSSAAEAPAGAARARGFWRRLLRRG
jgi:hypothetical protein